MGPYGLSDKINLVKDPAPRCGCSTASLKLRERQRFFEEVFQHDVDATCPRPPIGSISSMEVNEALDVFFSSEGEEGVLTSPLPGMETRNTAEGCEKALRGYTPNGILYLTHRSKETTTTTRSSVMDSFDTSLEVSMPSPFLVIAPADSTDAGGRYNPEPLGQCFSLHLVVQFLRNQHEQTVTCWR
uniref:Uncharacterized protein n=1 Tax=Cyclopterus lumpus TaxID=8103 RepID=A0A8C3AB56_CYCLU